MLDTTIHQSSSLCQGTLIVAARGVVTPYWGTYFSFFHHVEIVAVKMYALDSSVGQRDEPTHQKRKKDK